MTSSASDIEERQFSRNMMTSFIQIATLVILVSACLVIVGPFVAIIVWGIILAVAVFPLHNKLTAVLGGRAKWSATLITLIGLAVVIVPGWLVIDSSLSTAHSLQANIEDGGLNIPPPNENVKGWPVIGEKAWAVWSDASENLEATLAKYEPQVKALGEKAFHMAGGLVSGMLHFVASVIIAGFFMMYARQGYETTSAIGDRISPDRGSHMADLMVSTIRSVTNGVLGVAAIQAGLAGIGFVAIGMPAPGVFTLVILLTAIVQIPAAVIMIPLIIWTFSFAPVGSATVFAVYAMVVALSDNVLKPLLLGRGVDLPVLVVLLGAIGGMITLGVIGLFIGAVILGIGYQVISDWIWKRDLAPAADEPVA